MVSVLPGVYLAAHRQHDREFLRRAAMLWDPDAVVTGRSAAAEQLWPRLRHNVIELASPHHHRAVPGPGFRFTRRAIPPGFIVRRSGVRYTSIALTAVDLCLDLGGEVVDRALRTRKVTPDQLRAALTACPGRRGNGDRRRAILDATGNPWSYAERLAHRLLHRAGVHAWRGNPRLSLFGSNYYPDVLFDDCRLVLEVDGHTYHSDPNAFQYDRERRNDFVLSGYTVLQFTMQDLETDASRFIRQVRAGLAMLGCE